MRVPEGLHHLNHQFPPPGHGRGVLPGLPGLPGTRPGWHGGAPRIGAHIGGPSEAGDATASGGGAISPQVDLQGGADEQVAGRAPRRLAEGPVGTQGAVGSGEEDVGSGSDVGLLFRVRTRRSGFDSTKPDSMAGDHLSGGDSGPSGGRCRPGGRGFRHRSAAAVRWPPHRSRCRDSGAPPGIRRRGP